MHDGDVTNWAGRHVQLHQADLSQIGEVLAVLDEAAEWLRSAEVQQWPRRFAAEWVAPDVEQGHTWLADLDGEPAATMTLTWSDPLWERDDGSAGYVHRLAVRRHAAGLGSHLLQCAVAEIHRRHRRFLRLDCVASNRRLRSYYERAGFQHCGDIEVGGAPGQRYGHPPRTVVSRYQLVLPPIEGAPGEVR